MNRPVMVFGSELNHARPLIEYLLDQKFDLVLASLRRSGRKVARSYGLGHVVFDLDHAPDHLQNIGVLINCACPLVSSQQQLIKACIQTKSHYLDTYNYLEEVSPSFNFVRQTMDAGIAVVSGAGFAALTDLASMNAANALSDPYKLEVFCATRGASNLAAVRQLLEHIPKSGFVLQEGNFERAVSAESTLSFSVFDHTFEGLFNPWHSELYTGLRSTGIRNIATYSRYPYLLQKMAKGKFKVIRKMLLFLIGKLDGVSSKAKSTTHVLVRVSNAQAQEATIEIAGPSQSRIGAIMVAKMLGVLHQKESENLAGVHTASSLLKLSLADLPELKVHHSKAIPLRKTAC